jgi:hypothetical protein
MTEDPSVDIRLLCPRGRVYFDCPSRVRLILYLMVQISLSQVSAHIGL